jgi:hypothetical protein
MPANDTLAVSISAAMNWVFSDTTDVLASTPRDAQTISPVYTWPDGTGANAADMIWRDARTLATGADESLDLSGVLEDVFGKVCAFARVKALLIWNTSTIASSILTVGNGATPWQGWVSALGSVTVRPGGMLLLVAPDATAWPVVGGASDILKIANAAGGDATYKIVIIGASA